MKKGYYLMLDSFIAIAILLTGILLAKSFLSAKPEQSFAKNYADNVVNVMGSSKISDLCKGCECTDPKLGELCASSKIKNYNNTIIDLIGELHSSNKREEREEITPLIESFVINNSLIPGNFGFSFILHENMDYEYYPTFNSPPSQDSTSETTSLLLQSKKIIFGFWEDSGGTIEYWGPYTIEARIWQK